MRPVAELPTTRAASVHKVSPAATRCDVPVHEAGVVAGVAVGGVALTSAGASTFPPVVTSARNGSRGAWVGAAAIGAANVGAWTTGCDRGAAEAVTTGGDDTSVPSARAIGWRAIT